MAALYCQSFGVHFQDLLASCRTALDQERWPVIVAGPLSRGPVVAQGNSSTDLAISIVIPVYRSEKMLEPLIGRLVSVLSQHGEPFEIICVDDSSPDGAWAVLKRLRAHYGPTLKIVRLLVNAGQHNAILCGFRVARGQVVVTMDDDLQHPPEEVPKLLAAVAGGCDLVIGAYDEKQHPGWRTLGGSLVDAIQRRMFRLPRHFQLTSFRAIRRPIIERVCEMSSAYPYLTSMLLSQTNSPRNVLVHHEPRSVGRSSYTLGRSLKLCANLIWNHTTYPIYLVASLCGLAFLLSTVCIAVTLVKSFTTRTGVPGWASLMMVTSFFNGLTLLACLVMSVYISRIHQQLHRTRVQYTIGEQDV